jgi:hypothetical protein
MYVEKRRLYEKFIRLTLMKLTIGGEEEQQTPYGIIDESIHKR